jgi:hypothetical protein
MCSDGLGRGVRGTDAAVERIAAEESLRLRGHVPVKVGVG